MASLFSAPPVTLLSKIDLTGHLRGTSVGRPVALGQRADILTAHLIPTGDSDSEKKTLLVAVKVLRAGSVSDLHVREQLRGRIARWLPLWKSLSHPFICPFLGVSYDEPFSVALVLPYYANGNIVNYLRRHPTADTYTLINQVAQGLLYLHTHTPPVVHQDIRGSNVLIDDVGRARLVDYGLVEALHEITFTTPNLPFLSRNQAPELLMGGEDNENAADSPFTTQSDVYSFAMLGVEMVTRDRPFSHRKIITAVVVDVMQGRRPRRPAAGNAGVADLLLADRLWPIFESCWVQNPTERPDMRKVCERLAAA